MSSAQFLLSWSKLGRKEYMKDPRQCEVYLKRLQFFLNLIGNPEKQILHYIHVTGTSGKGSVCLMLEAILRADKKHVGTMTSPEIGPTQTIWQVNGQVMSDAEFTKIITELKPKLEKYLKISPYDPISHFELMTAIGLYWFAKKRVEYAILEVGCGGRYDSTNIIPYKDIAVITNIGLDHTDILGKTKAKIAYKKAGIIKRGNLVFTAERNKKILEIIRHECKKQKASLEIFNFKFLILKQFLNYQIFNYQNNNYKLSCLGVHQISNAILAIEIAKALKIPYSIIKRGLEKVKLPLRMEIVSKNPLIILDGAHNPDKMKTTVDTMKQVLKFTSTQVRNLPTCQLANLHLLVGFSADKDIHAMIKQLATLKPATIAITKNTINPFRKVAEPKKIKQLFGKYLPNTKIKTFLDPKEALAWSKLEAKREDIILSTGSIFVSGEIKSAL